MRIFRWRGGPRRLRLLVSAKGSVVAEHGVAIALVGAVVVGGASLLGTTVGRTWEHLTLAAAFDKPAVAGGERRAASAAASSRDNVTNDAFPDRSPCGILFWTAWFVPAGLILGYAGYWARRRRRPRRDLWDQETPPDEAEELRVQASIYVKRQNLLRALSPKGGVLAKEEITVADLMTQQLLVVSPETPVEALKTLMVAHRVHHLLVCEQRDRLVGVVSDRDLHARRGKTARQVMTPHPRSISSDTPLASAITCLLSRQISCLPVVDEGRLRGVLTTADLTLITQCVLQWWLRLSHEMHSKLSWTEELARVAKLADHGLDEQETQLARLSQVLDRVTACAKPETCHGVPAQIEEILASTKRLTALIAKTYTVLREQGSQGTTVGDSRSDPLTGLNSRFGLEEILGTMIAMKARYGQPFSLLLVAMGRRVEPDDLAGEEPEPRVLQEVAQRLVQGARQSDLVARYAPHALAVVLTHTGADGAGAALARIGQNLQKDSGDAGQAWAVRLAVVSGLDREPLQDLLARADAALVEAVADAPRGVASDRPADLHATGSSVSAT